MVSALCTTSRKLAVGSIRRVGGFFTFSPPLYFFPTRLYFRIRHFFPPWQSSFSDLNSKLNMIRQSFVKAGLTKLLGAVAQVFWLGRRNHRNGRRRGNYPNRRLETSFWPWFVFTIGAEKSTSIEKHRNLLIHPDEHSTRSQLTQPLVDQGNNCLYDIPWRKVSIFALSAASWVSPL